jgi:hypothetical protein
MSLSMVYLAIEWLCKTQTVHDPGGLRCHIGLQPRLWGVRPSAIQLIMFEEGQVIESSRIYRRAMQGHEGREGLAYCNSGQGGCLSTVHTS